MDVAQFREAAKAAVDESEFCFSSYLSILNPAVSYLFALLFVART